MSPSSPPAPERPGQTPPRQKPPGQTPPGLLKRLFIRYGTRFFVDCYLRVKVVGLENRLAAPHVLCFNHPNWVDPFLIVAFLPSSPQLYIFGPKEEDMSVGWRNKLITWSHMAVPFRESKTDLIDTTRRATAVLKGGNVLAIAAEGRLSDREGEIVPLQSGAAFFALRAKVPIVPVAIVGTRWLHFGKRVTLRIGEALGVEGLRSDREGMATLTERLTAALDALLQGANEDPPPGPFGRWMTDVFNERPWLKQETNDPVDS